MLAEPERVELPLETPKISVLPLDEGSMWWVCQEFEPG